MWRAVGLVLVGTTATSGHPASILCNATPGAVYPPLVGEYEATPVETSVYDLHGVQAQHRNQNRNQHRYRNRRASETIRRRYVVSGLDFDDGEVAVTTQQRRAIYDAYRFMMRAYNLDDDEDVPITVRIATSATIPAGSVVGSWTPAEIVLYMNAITSVDMLFAITIHELLHDFAFSYVTDGGSSFQDRTDDTTLVHNGTSVDACFETTGGSVPTIYTDITQAHWWNDRYPFASDVMEPVLPTNGVSISPCTLAAVVDTRPTWSTMTCVTTVDCGFNYTCYHIGDHLGKLCLALKPTSTAATRNSHQYPVFTAYIYTVMILFMVLYQCGKLPQNKHSMLATLLVDPIRE